MSDCIIIKREMSSLHTGQLKHQLQEANALLTGQKASGRCPACTRLRAFASHQPLRQQPMESGDLFPWILAWKQVTGTAPSPLRYRLLAETKEVATAAWKHNLPVRVKLLCLSNLRCALQLCGVGLSLAGGTRPNLRCLRINGEQ